MTTSAVKNICLIQPPPSFRTPDCCLPSEYVGVGLLALSAFLESHGFPTKIFHIPLAIKAGMTPRQVFRQISLFKPDLFAVGMNWVHFSSGAVETASRLRELFPRVPIVVGGQHASLFPDEVAALFSKEFDAVIVGEAELPLLQICRSLSGERAIPSGIPGVRVAGSTNDTPPAELIGDIDDLPFQSFQRIYPGYDRPLAAVGTMRGLCAHSCIYCLEGSRGVPWKRRRPALHSIDYIAEQIRRFSDEGKHIVTIEDQFSQRGDNAAGELADRILSSGTRLIEFNLFAEPGALSAGGLRAIASISTGLVSVDYGIETGAPDVADACRARFKLTDFPDRVRDTTAAGILPFTWWMVGFPGEGDEQLRQTRELILESMALGAIPRWATPLVLFPRTEMFIQADRLGVAPAFRRFGDYLKFSLEPRNDFGHYPGLVTHSTDRLSRGRIADETLSIKRMIVDNWRLVDAYYDSNPALRDKYRSRARMLSTEKETLFPLDSFF